MVNRRQPQLLGIFTFVIIALILFTVLLIAISDSADADQSNKKSIVGTWLLEGDTNFPVHRPSRH